MSFKNETFCPIGTASAVCPDSESHHRHTATKRAWGRNPTLLVGVPNLDLDSARHAWLFDLCVRKGKIKPRKVIAQAVLHVNGREYMQKPIHVNSHVPASAAVQSETHPLARFTCHPQWSVNRLRARQHRARVSQILTLISG